MGWGKYTFPSPQSLIFFFFGWGGLRTSCVSGKGNKGPLCPVGVGPPFPWTPINPLTGTWRVRLKVGGGGPGVTGAWLIMWWPGGGCLPYVLNRNKNNLKHNILLVQPKSGCLKTRDEAAPHHFLLSNLRGAQHHQGRWGTRGCAQQPSRASASAVCRGYEWLNSCGLLSAAPSQPTYTPSSQWATVNTCVWNSLQEIHRVHHQKNHEPSSSRTAAYLSTFQARKHRLGFKQGAIFIVDAPRLCQKWVGFFPPGGAPQWPRILTTRGSTCIKTPNSICSSLSIYRCISVIKNFTSWNYQPLGEASTHTHTHI